MAFNIVDLVKDQMSDAVMNQLGSVLGGSSDATSKAVDGAIPSILEGLMNKAGSADGADSIFKAVQDQDDGILSNLGDLIGGGIDSPFASMGFTVLRSLLGNSMLGNIAGAVGGISGLGRSKSSSMLGLVAPIIFGVLKRKVLGGGLNASSLASMLTGQKSNIAAAMPAGFAEKVGSADMIDDVADTVKGGVGSVSKAASTAADTVGQAAGSVGNAAVDTASTGGGMLGKLLPLILLLGAAFFGLKMFGGKGTTTEDVVVQSQPAPVVTETVTAPTEVVTEAVTPEVVTEVATSAVAAVIASGTLSGRNDHITTGNVSIVQTASGYELVLAEDFSLDGAPDPVVALGNNGTYSPENKLGPLTNITGAQSYAIPANINPADFTEAYIWCEQFNVSLGTAALTINGGS